MPYISVNFFVSIGDITTGLVIGLMPKTKHYIFESCVTLPLNFRLNIYKKIMGEVDGIK